MRPTLLIPALLALVCCAAAPQAQQLDLRLNHKLGAGIVRLGYTLGQARPAQRLPQQHWVAGHFETVEQQVWVPGTCERIWCDPVYRTAYDYCGRPYRVLVTPGGWKTVETPGRFETRCVRVWVEGAWVYAACH